ncbi:MULTISPECIES: 6-phosphogluconolactonase [unclassified Luteococcus]|uniref:6-phosphogluconolactonase n=1 Tax=unclassified Luteococcus TaxID=2639923 RepID=UPI00313DABDC
MTAPRVLRHQDTDELVADAAQMLLDTLVDLQSKQETVHLCLTGGRTANRIYQRFAELVPDSGLNPAALHLWWGDERFVPTTDPERHAVGALSILARTLQLSSAQTHPMPASDGKADPDESAFAYARELGETVFDICLLGMGEDGHVASLIPGTLRSDQTSSLVVGVTDFPHPPSERITLTLNAINRSRRVWLWVSGANKAAPVAEALTGDGSAPGAQVAGTVETLWFLDQQSAAQIPQYRCEF